MKKFLILFVFLPFVSFGAFDLDGFDGVRVNGVYLFTWLDFDKTSTRTFVPFYQLENEDQFYSVFASGSWGFKVNLRRTSSTGMQYTIRVPSLSFSPLSAPALGSISNCVQGATNGLLVVFSPLVVPRVTALYQSAATLFAQGYRGPGVSWFQSSGTSSNFCVNVNYPLLLSDVLSSTNTLYRQILLGYLSSIQSSVASIDSGVSALAPVLSDIRDINSSISSNTASVAASSSLIADNTASVAQSSAFAASNTFSIAESSSNMASNSAAIVQSSALMASNTASIVQSSAIAASNTVAIAQSSAFAASNTASIAESSSLMASNTTAIAESSSNMASNTSAIAESSSLMASNTTAIADSSSLMASNTTAIAESSSLMASNSTAIAESSSLMASNTTAIAESSSLMASNTTAIADSSKSISDNTSSLPDSLDKIFNQVYDSNGMTGNILSELYGDKELIRYISAALSGDPSKLPPNNPYFPYDPNDPTDPNHPSNPNSPLNPNSPNSLTGGGGLGAFTTNQVMRPITNALDDASNAIQSNATSNADSIRENDDRNWQNFMDQATGDGPGLNVRITYPIAGQDAQAVNVYDYGVIGAIENNWRPLLDELKNFSDNFTAYMQGGVNVNLPSNLLDDVISPLYDLTNRPSYLLLDDYADYISNGVYSASVSAFIADFPGVYSNLVHYGLVSDGNGNFWTLFGANLLYQSGLIGSLLNDMALVRSFCDEHMDGGLSGGVSNITSRLPSPTELEDWLNTYTGLVSDVELASTNFVSALKTLTNYSHSVFSPFEGSFDSVPTDLVLFKLAGEHYVTVPVAERMDVWRLLHYGIAFSLVAVNFILFPKFVLMLVVLFSRLSNRFVRFLPTDR